MRKLILFSILIILLSSFVLANDFNYMEATAISNATFSPGGYEVSNLNDGCTGSAACDVYVYMDVGNGDSEHYNFDLNFSEQKNFVNITITGLDDASGGTHPFNVYIQVDGIDITGAYRNDGTGAENVFIDINDTVGNKITMRIDHEEDGGYNDVYLGEFEVHGFNVSAPSTYFEITALNFWNSSSLNTFNATLDNGTFYSTTTGTITTSILQNSTNLFNFTIRAQNYYINLTLNYNVSSDLEVSLFQSIINFSCYEKITNNSLTCVNGTINPNADTYNFSVGVNNYFNVTQEETINFLDNKTLDFTGFYYANLTFINNFVLGLGNASTNCNYSINSTTYPSYNEDVIGPNGSSAGLINGTFFITANCDAYAYAYANVTINSTPQSVTFDLYPSNSITIYLFDETSGISLNGTNITVTKTFGITQQENFTSTGNISYQNLTAGNYTFSFEGVYYPSRSYSVTIGNKTFQTLNVYLLANTTDAVIFAFREEQSNQLIAGLTLTINKILNGTDTLIAVLTSDITGRTQFYFDATDQYCFSASKTGYVTRTFCLNPIIFSSYDITMTASVEASTGDDFEGLLIDWSPSRYWNNQNNTITFTFAQPEGSLTNYGFNATYKTNTVTRTGTNAYGEVLSDDLEITGAVYGDKVIIHYYYKTTTDAEYRTFKLIYDVFGYNASSDSLTSSPPGNYGLGDFEATFISVSGTLLVAGAGALYGGALASGVLGLFMFAWFMYIGFLNFWAGVISLIMLFVIVAWRSTQ